MRFTKPLLICVSVLAIGCSNSQPDSTIAPIKTTSTIRRTTSTTNFRDEVGKAIKDYWDYIEGVANAESRRKERSNKNSRNIVNQSRNKPSPISATDDIWWRLAGCETGYKYDNPNTGNGYYGYFQFSATTWRSVGGSGLPHHHSYEVQKSFAIRLQQRSGWGQWPKCSRILGLR